MPDTKAEKLAERRRNLAQLLQQENMRYQVRVRVQTCEQVSICTYYCTKFAGFTTF